MSEEGKEMRRRVCELYDKQSSQRNELLTKYVEIWREETKLLERECGQKIGHQFSPYPNRNRNLAGTLLERCDWCGAEKPL